MQNLLNHIKSFIVVALLLLCIGTANGEYTFSSPAQTFIENEKLIIPVVLKNSAEVIGFQMELTLPSGLTLAENNNKEYKLTLSSRCPKHKASVNYFEGKYYIVVSSIPNTAITGNDGEVFTIEVVNNNGLGTYDIRFDNVIVSDGERHRVNCSSFSCKLIVKERDIENIAQYDLDKGQLEEIKTEIERLRTKYKAVEDLYQSTFSQTLSKYNELVSKLQQAFEKSKETRSYTTPWTASEINSLKEELSQKDAECTQQHANKVKADADNDRNTLQRAREASQNLIGATDEQYPAFVITTDKESIFSRYDSLSSDIDNAQNTAVETLTPYESPSVAEVLLEIDTMVTKYQSDVAAATIQAKEEASEQVENDKAHLRRLSDQLEEISDIYGPTGCLDLESYEEIVTRIEDLYDLIDEALEKIFITGSYQSPCSDDKFQDIDEAIETLAHVCFNNFEKVVTDTAEADRQKVDAFKEDFLAFLENLHQEYGNLLNSAREEELDYELNDIYFYNRIDNTVENALNNLELYVSPDVDATIEDINSQMLAYEQDIKKISELIAKDTETLNELLRKLEEISEMYADYLDAQEYASLTETIDGLFDRLYAAGEEAVSSEDQYQTPWVDGEINQVNEAIINLEYDCYYKHLDAIDEASNNDRMKVNTVREEFDVLCRYLHSEYPNPCNIFMENEIAAKLDDLLNQINQEATDAQNKKHPYNSPDVEQTLEEIRSDIEVYEKYVKGSVLSNEEIDRLAALDTLVPEELESRLEEIFNAYQDYLEMEEYESLSDAIDELFNRLEQSQKEAYDTHKYSTPWEEEEIDDLRTRMDELEKNAQEAGIFNVEADPGEAIYYDLNGRRILNPTPGKLYIRILGGKSQKVII